MRLDVEDVLAGEFGRFFRIILFVLSACWVGSMIGGLAWFFGTWDLTPGDLVFALPALWSAPALLISDWMIPNLGLLVLAITILFVTDHTGYAAWGTIVGIESILALLGTSYQYEPASVVIVSTLSWLVLLVMVETGVWLIRNMRMNRWVRELAVLNAENAMQRAEREQSPRKPADGETTAGETLK